MFDEGRVCCLTSGQEISQLFCWDSSCLLELRGPIVRVRWGRLLIMCLMECNQLCDTIRTVNI